MKKLKAYTRENYRCSPIWGLLAEVRHDLLLLGFAAVVSTLVVLALSHDMDLDDAGTSDRHTSPSPTPVEAMNDWHLVHGRLYGSRYKPISRVETDLPLTSETEGFNIELEWVGRHRNLLHATDRHGNPMGTRLVELSPRADMDDDGDVDEDDQRSYANNPFDVNIDGRIDRQDRENFRSWMGWTTPHRKKRHGPR